MRGRVGGRGRAHRGRREVGLGVRILLGSPYMIIVIFVLAAVALSVAR